MSKNIMKLVGLVVVTLSLVSMNVLASSPVFYPSAPDQPRIDRAAKWIGNRHTQTISAHPLVFAAGERSVEAKRPQLAHQFTP